MRRLLGAWNYCRALCAKFRLVYEKSQECCVCKYALVRLFHLANDLNRVWSECSELYSNQVLLVVEVIELIILSRCVDGELFTLLGLHALLGSRYGYRVSACCSEKYAY